MDINLLIVIVLITLAIIDLMVGVANDAVNFLNSAIGAKAASFKLIVLVAAAGVLTGVLMSNGMMEIARKGIFYPQQFIMPELMIIFVAVMFQDIILLDTFNTFGLPTSTTVSIVFGLFGSALSISIIKIFNSGAAITELSNYIQFDKVLTIMGAIIFSIILAFIVGALVQFITRLIFTFNYKDRFSKYGPIWGGFALTALSFFLLLKGIKGATFVTDEFATYVKSNIPQISVILLFAWTLILFVLMKVFKANILRFIVLFGTFSLALAFAANDLVNFIGAPIAGLNAYQLAMASPDPLTSPMGALAKEIQAESWMLIIAGLVMVVTLFFNKKAYTVARTTISLSRQEEGYERFSSNFFSRWIVRRVIKISNGLASVLGKSYQEFVNKRLDPEQFKPDADEDGEKPAFDLLRAAVILMVAAMLISFATSLKLPLSTTYVTFIVAMAAALPDKAWGRESAVYRVAGVVTVVLGWFATALSASIIAGTIAAILYFGGIYALIFFILFTAYLIFKNIRVHRNRESVHNASKGLTKLTKAFAKNALDSAIESSYTLINDINNNISNSVGGLIKDDVKITKKAYDQIFDLKASSDRINVDLLKLIDHDDEGEIEFADDFALTISSLKDLHDSAHEITQIIHDYVNNNHKPLLDVQKHELLEVDNELSDYFDIAFELIKKRDFSRVNELANFKLRLDARVSDINKYQLERLKQNRKNLRRSLLYLNILKEIQTLSDRCIETLGALDHLYNMDKFKITETN